MKRAVGVQKACPKAEEEEEDGKEDEPVEMPGRSKGNHVNRNRGTSRGLPNE